MIGLLRRSLVSFLAVVFGKQCLVCLQRQIIATTVVTLDPFEQKGQVVILFRLRGILVWFPRTRSAVGQTLDKARVQQYQLGCKGQCGANQFAITAFDDPALVRAAEGLNVIRRLLGGPQRGRRIGDPSYRIEVQHRERACLCQAPRQCAFA